MKTWIPFKVPFRVSLRIVLPFSFGFLTSLRLLCRYSSLETSLGALVHFLPSAKNAPKHKLARLSPKISPPRHHSLIYSSCAILSAMPCQDLSRRHPSLTPQILPTHPTLAFVFSMPPSTFLSSLTRLAPSHSNASLLCFLARCHTPPSPFHRLSGFHLGRPPHSSPGRRRLSAFLIPACTRTYLLYFSRAFLIRLRPSFRITCHST
ncbi:hypothetical protein EDB89DRAFT_1102522 [Lactarius sanguifluus]|nr:hypothetical protein EDB89DRAFT_1102522 [Lactarius sanguifluus]